VRLGWKSHIKNVFVKVTNSKVYLDDLNSWMLRQSKFFFSGISAFADSRTNVELGNILRWSWKYFAMKILLLLASNDYCIIKVSLSSSLIFCQTLGKYRHLFLQRIHNSFHILEVQGIIFAEIIRTKLFWFFP
jgi:hypothetical protein